MERAGSRAQGVLKGRSLRSQFMPDKKPNILVIFGDDIGMWNVGAYTHGMMGETPNIDRIAKA